MVSIMQWRSAIGGFACSSSVSSPRISSRSSAASLSSFQCFCLGFILATLTFQLAVQLSYPSIYNNIHGSELQQPKSSTLHDPADHSQGLLMASNLSHLTSKQRNQLMKAVNGNRANRGIKLAHWNAGSAHLCNKMNELE